METTDDGQTKVLIVDDDRPTRDRALKLGATGFICKPVKLVEMLRTLQEHLGG